MARYDNILGTIGRTPVVRIDEKLGFSVDEGSSLGSYELESRVGAGGMGEVWRARHQLLARPAAIKIIKGDAVGDGEHAATMTARFQRRLKQSCHPPIP